MLYRGTKSLFGRLKSISREAQETRAMCKLVITPPARVVGLCSSVNSVFRCDGVEKDRVRLEI